MKAKIIQFNWRRNWSQRVAPHLDHELVQTSLDLGMMRLDPNWQRGDPPFLLGVVRNLGTMASTNAANTYSQPSCAGAPSKVLMACAMDSWAVMLSNRRMSITTFGEHPARVRPEPCEARRLRNANRVQGSSRPQSPWRRRRSSGIGS